MSFISRGVSGDSSQYRSIQLNLGLFSTNTKAAAILLVKWGFLIFYLLCQYVKYWATICVQFRTLLNFILFKKLLVAIAYPENISLASGWPRRPTGDSWRTLIRRIHAINHSASLFCIFYADTVFLLSSASDLPLNLREARPELIYAHASTASSTSCENSGKSMNTTCMSHLQRFINEWRLYYTPGWSFKESEWLNPIHFDFYISLWNFF